MIENWSEASPISLPEVSEIAKKLLSSKVPGVDAICPEILKALDIVGLSWLTYFFSVAWRWEQCLWNDRPERLRSGKAPADCQTSDPGGAMCIPP